MTKYFTQGEDGNYSEVDVDSMFENRHERWVKSESEKIRSEVEGKTRDELTKSLTESLTKQIGDKTKAEYEPKLKEANDKVTNLETSLRQKTIAAEYGFKAGTEKYLGTGSEDDMRKEADNLKANFVVAPKAPDKHTSNGVSKIQEKTGVAVTV